MSAQGKIFLSQGKKCWQTEFFCFRITFQVIPNVSGGQPHTFFCFSVAFRFCRVCSQGHPPRTKLCQVKPSRVLTKRAKKAGFLAKQMLLFLSMDVGEDMVWGGPPKPTVHVHGI